ncbi:DNA polymerase IV [Desulfuromonas versatilis]|uniref:DNA polymerase IV n=1 Tax=Desulfuromonas versatilis TaxID=2802975 RepID=UPI001C846DEE|nr:DNA polymerase IV [Desulfuromonas versatilis]
MRKIIHLDMDAFYASVEQRDRPELKGKPVIVGGSRERGVVCACSYETRAFGVRSAMAVARALRLCPQALVLPVRMARYQQVSAEIFEIFGRYTDCIEKLSIDEGFLDVTGSERLFGPARQIAERLRAEVRAETGLAVSAGVASNKFLAKVASELAKPDGLLEVPADQVDQFLLPLPVSRIWGVGRVTAERLERRGWRTIRELRAVPLEQLQRLLGAAGEQVYRLARGLDERPVVADEPIKSIGAEETFERDLRVPEALARELLALCERVAARLRRRGLVGRCVTLKVKYADFSAVSRSLTLERGLDSALAIQAEALRLLGRTEAGSRPVRLLGVSLAQLEAGQAAQPELFGEEQRRRQSALDQAVDRLRERFGESGIRRATLLEGSPRPSVKKGGDPGE